MLRHHFVAALFLASSLAVPASQAECAVGAHIITVRGTSARLNGGFVRQLADKVQARIAGSDIEDINYPAVLTDYIRSEREGVTNTTVAIEDYVKRCPQRDIILLGYSQGAEAIGDILCGANHWSLPPIYPLPIDIGQHVKAAILMGDPSHAPGAPFNVGNSTKHGWFSRNTDNACPVYADILQSYCDADDLYCDSGTSISVHTGYVAEYGDQAVEFVLSKIEA